MVEAIALQQFLCGNRCDDAKNKDMGQPCKLGSNNARKRDGRKK
jgi:hypothetical protein